MANKLVQLKDKDKNNIFSVPYFPIGYIYLSTSSINPSEIFGGVWEPIKDKFLLLAGDTYTGGQTGGEATHKLTVNETPSHNHYPSDKGANWVPNTGSMSRRNVALGSSGVYVPAPDSGVNGWKWGGTSFVGGGQAHNNMPPFLAVYGWVKVSN